MKMEQTECSETSEYKIQTPGNYPEESIQHFKAYRLRDATRELTFNNSTICPHNGLTCFIFIS